MRILYHFTCRHGHDDIRASGVLLRDGIGTPDELADYDATRRLLVEGE